MTKERKEMILSMAKQNYHRGITKKEIQELEQEYGISCKSYSCGSCVLNFLKRILTIYEKNN